MKFREGQHVHFYNHCTPRKSLNVGTIERIIDGKYDVRFPNNLPFGDERIASNVEEKDIIGETTAENCLI